MPFYFTTPRWWRQHLLQRVHVGDLSFPYNKMTITHLITSRAAVAQVQILDLLCGLIIPLEHSHTHRTPTQTTSPANSCITSLVSLALFLFLCLPSFSLSLSFSPFHTHAQWELAPWSKIREKAESHYSLSLSVALSVCVCVYIKILPSVCWSGFVTEGRKLKAERMGRGGAAVQHGLFLITDGKCAFGRLPSSPSSSSSLRSLCLLRDFR